MAMRVIDAGLIKQAVKELLLYANYHLPEDIKERLNLDKKSEVSEIGEYILENIIRNAELAEKNSLAICQDTGMCIVFIELGQAVYVDGNNLADCINTAVREAYSEDYLRKSIVKDPLNRVNTGDNTPAVIYYDIVPGDNAEAG